jgi:hypothetical protein
VQKLRAKLKNKCFLLVDLQNCSARCSPIIPGRQNPRSFILQTTVYKKKKSAIFSLFEFCIACCVTKPIANEKEKQNITKEFECTNLCLFSYTIDRCPASMLSMTFHLTVIVMANHRSWNLNKIENFDLLSQSYPHVWLNKQQRRRAVFAPR